MAIRWLEAHHRRISHKNPAQQAAWAFAFMVHKNEILFTLDSFALDRSNQLKYGCAWPKKTISCARNSIAKHFACITQFRYKILVFNKFVALIIVASVIVRCPMQPPPHSIAILLHFINIQAANNVNVIGNWIIASLNAIQLDINSWKLPDTTKLVEKYYVFK